MVAHAGPYRSRSCASPDGHRLDNFNSDIWYQHVDPDDTCSRQGHTDRAEGAPAQRIRVLASPAGESRPGLRYASSLTAAYHQTIQPTLNSQAGKCDETHPLVASMRPNLTLSLHWTVRPSIPRRRQCPTGLLPQTVGCVRRPPLLRAARRRYAVGCLSLDHQILHRQADTVLAHRDFHRSVNTRPLGMLRHRWAGCSTLHERPLFRPLA
jgi:hypothetical protein